MTLTITSFRVLALVCVAIAQSQALSLNSCDSFTCQNNGTCTFSTDALPRCSCKPGYSGVLCEIEISLDFNEEISRMEAAFYEIKKSPCSNNSECLNGGSCTAYADARYCRCIGGYTGDKCELKIEGQCPAVKEDNSEEDSSKEDSSKEDSLSICGGNLCDNDTECFGGQKCCPNSCGGNICTNATTTEDRPLCLQGCLKGYTCEFRPVPCKLGMMCQILIPTCVPPKDSCGGCPNGQVCKPTGIVCVAAPCTNAFKCVPVVPVTTPKPLAVCNLLCMKGYECKLEVPACSQKNKKNCSNRSVPTCVPKCPTIKGSRRQCPNTSRPKNNCSSDNECSKNKNQRCCPSTCQWNVCTNVNKKN